MRARVLWLLLVVSLALNLGLAGGALYYQSGAERLAGASDTGFEEISARLALTDRQRADFLALRTRAEARRMTVMPERDARRAAFLAELAKPELDRVRLAEIMDSGADLRRALVQDLISDLHALLATLSPEQKENFLAMARERHFLRRVLGFGPGPDRPKAEPVTQARN